MHSSVWLFERCAVSEFGVNWLAPVSGIKFCQFWIKHSADHPKILSPSVQSIMCADAWFTQKLSVCGLIASNHTPSALLCNIMNVR